MKEVQPIRDPLMIESMKNELLRTGYRDYLLFHMGINTGLRVSDLLALKVGDVRDKDVYVLKELKTKKTKRINLHAVKEAIRSYTGNMNEDDYLFKSRNGDNQPITRVQAYRVLNDAAKQVGLSDIGTHTMRKTFGYHFYKKYKDVAMLQTLFNHSAPSITLRYIGISQDDIDEKVREFAL